MKTINISDETYEKIKDQIIEEDKKVEKKEKINIEIKSKFLGNKILYSSEKETVKEAVVEAVVRGANLMGANLMGANLVRASLESANLVSANLMNADLRGADFYHTKFFGKGGNTRIRKNQIDDFLIALGVVVDKLED